MSNFETFALITEGNISTAPSFFSASTEDSLATMLVEGYMDDKGEQGIVKQNDRVAINYADESVFPLNTGEAAIYGEFRVNYNPNNGTWSLLATAATPSGIGALGVYSAQYTNAGGSATTTIVDDSINANMVVIAFWATSANAVSVYTVSPGNGTLTVVSSADPGASKLSYMAFIPSVALQNAGVFAAKYANAGGSATVTILDANITADMVAEVSFVSQANVSIVQKVTVAAGSLTVLCSANPGVSVLSYTAQLPSTALTNLGLYATAYTNAGGSATTSISDANITASSVVIGSWDTSANAVNIQKITATAGTLTVLSSADPGASVFQYSATPQGINDEDANYLISTNNLSDVASASTALSNLGGVPLAGGQMTGTLRTTKGTGTEAANAVTISPLTAQSGVITTSALTTASEATYVIAVTNSAVAADSVILLSWMGGTNTIGFSAKAVYTSAGVWTITIKNTDVAAAALDGTIILGYTIL